MIYHSPDNELLKVPDGAKFRESPVLDFPTSMDNAPDWLDIIAHETAPVIG